MEQLIELLTQIQDLAGVAIDALTEAAGGAPGGEAPPEGALPEEGAPPGGELPPGGPGGPPPPA
jgi:hypothetical protein